MASIDFSLDSRVKKTYVPLVSQQLHLRHLKRIAARNLQIPVDDHIDSNDQQKIGFRFELLTTEDRLFYQSETLFTTSPEWKAIESSSFSCPAISEMIIRLYLSRSAPCGLCPDNVCLSSHLKHQTVTNVYSEHLFIEWKLHLSGLVFIGEEIPKDNRFKNNTIILGLMEGFYTSLDSIASEELSKQLCLRKDSLLITDASSCRNSYCLNVLYRIEMMQRVITQTSVLVNNTRTKLEDKLNKMSDISKLKSEVEHMEVKVNHLNNLLIVSRDKIEFCRETKVKNETEICEKGIDMLNKIQTLKQQKEKLLLKREKFGQTKERLTKMKSQLLIRRKQLLTDISKIYPLVPFPDGNGGFSICGVHLPDSEHLDGHDDTMISIAIGYVTHLLVLISRLLDVTLRYQIIYFGSRSSIVDHLNDKLTANNRIFPLHTKGTKDRMLFKYGVFLLNKNIAQLRHYLGLQTRDLSATLSNLYSLIRERLTLFSEDLMPSITANGLASTSSDGSHIDDYLRREMEVMRNQQDLHEAGPSKANAIRLKNLSNASNPIRVMSDRNITRSLDKGLNEIQVKSNKATNESVSSSLSSDGHSIIIPKHLLDSNQIHHNFSETDFKRINNCEPNSLESIDKNRLKWCETSDEELLGNGLNGVNGNQASSSDSSPADRRHWCDPNLNLETEKHSERN